MKLSIVLLGLLNVIAVNALLAAAPPAYKTTPDGVIIYTDPLVTGTSHAVKPEMITDNIIKSDGSSWKRDHPNEATKNITIGDRKGTFNAMLQKRMFRINVITPNEPKHLEFDAKCDAAVLYKGKKSIIKL